jgi:hypothetical protein
MKKLLVLMMVLGIAGAANAALLLSVDGVVDPPESSIEIMESDFVTIDIWGDGVTPGGDFFLGIGIEGPATLDVANAQILYTGNQKGIMDGNPDYAAYVGGGVNIPFYQITLLDLVPPEQTAIPLEGTLIDGIRLHCEGLGEVTVILTDIEGAILDTQVIHQIPEPFTVALLGLGGLFLRRRK